MEEIEVFETYNDYPQSASNNACKVLRWRDEHGDEVKGMTRVGWTRANQLCKREKISRKTIGRMAAFKRHQKNAEINPDYKSTPWKDKGYVAWLGWGGTSGVEWAIRKVKSIDKKTKLQEFAKWRSKPSSSNVKAIMYNDETQEMVIQFRNRSIYTYYKVSFKIFKDVSGGKARCLTKGKNKWGAWDVGKTPSVGASVHKYLVKNNIKYKKGGSLK